MLALMATTGLAVGVVTSREGKKTSVKEYSSPDKFPEPKYATIQDMEEVS